MSKNQGRSRWVDEMIRGLRSFAESLESGEPISGKFNVREVERTNRPESPTHEYENPSQGSNGSDSFGPHLE